MHCTVWPYREYSNDIQTVRIADIDDNSTQSHHTCRRTRLGQPSWLYLSLVPYDTRTGAQTLLNLSFLTGLSLAYARGKTTEQQSTVAVLGDATEANLNNGE